MPPSLDEILSLLAVNKALSYHCVSKGLSVLDLVSIDNDVLSLQNVFQSWLLDCSTDSEAIHLILPPGLRQTGLEEGERIHDSSLLTVKCDIQERLLDPNLMGSLGQQFVSLFLIVILLTMFGYV